MTFSQSGPGSGSDSSFADQHLVPQLLGELRRKSHSERELFESLQLELRRIARRQMYRERPDHTLQPTALVNEAFLKIFSAKDLPDFSEDLSRCRRLIAHAMEQILNDHADARNALKRGGKNRFRVPLDEQQAQEFRGKDSPPLLDAALLVDPEQSETIIAMREALQILKETSARQAEVVRLHFYCGLTEREISDSLGMSLETIKLDMRKAKAFLKIHLTSLKI
jgi:RNA polymerase sigma-70 factor, ECF subfamily